MTRKTAPFAAALLIFALDRITKLWIERSLAAFDEWVVIPGLVNIIHAENRGMAFSLMADWSSAWREFFLIGVSGAVLTLIATMLWQTHGAVQRWALTLVLGGALGNLYDRLARGSVTDFIDVHVRGYHWPTFNVADSAITVGALMLALELARERLAARHGKEV